MENPERVGRCVETRIKVASQLSRAELVRTSGWARVLGLVPSRFSRSERARASARPVRCS